MRLWKSQIPSVVDHEVGGEQLQAVDEPLASMVVVSAGEGIGAQEKRLAETLAEDMIRFLSVTPLFLRGSP